jgi:hypothetical protein
MTTVSFGFSKKAVSVNFNTDPTSAGLPEDFIARLAEPTAKVCSEILSELQH